MILLGDGGIRVWCAGVVAWRADTAAIPADGLDICLWCHCPVAQRSGVAVILPVGLGICLLCDCGVAWRAGGAMIQPGGRGTRAWCDCVVARRASSAATRLCDEEPTWEPLAHHGMTSSIEERAGETEVLRETVRLGHEQGGCQSVGDGGRACGECCVARRAGKFRGRRVWHQVGH